MEGLVIKSTNISPAVEFYPDGHLNLEGKIITENAVITFDPIFNWIKDFHAKKVEFNIYLEYMNTSATMQLFSLLNKLDENCEIEQISIKWYYEEDDEEHLETGEIFEERLERSNFEFIEVRERRHVA